MNKKLTAIRKTLDAIEGTQNMLDGRLYHAKKSAEKELRKDLQAITKAMRTAKGGGEYDT